MAKIEQAAIGAAPNVELAAVVAGRAEHAVFGIPQFVQVVVHLLTALVPLPGFLVVLEVRAGPGQVLAFLPVASKTAGSR